VTKSAVVQILIEIWDNLSPASIRSGWAIYEDEFGPDADEQDEDWEE
jgi:hypothetical protein